MIGINTRFQKAQKHIRFRLFVISITVLLTQTVFSQEILDPTTGDLYWDINSEVRLKYIYNCSLSRSSRSYYYSGDDPNVENAISKHNFYRRLDVFYVLDNLRFASCEGDVYDKSLGQSGIRAVYRLREDRLFPDSFQSDITINYQSIKYNEATAYDWGDYYDSENFQPIYSALQTNTVVTLRIHAWDARRRAAGFSDESEPKVLAEMVINTSNIVQSQLLRKNAIERRAEEINNEIMGKYKFIIVYDLLLLLATAILFFAYVSKFHPFVKRFFITLIKKIGNLFKMVGRGNKGDVHKKIGNLFKMVGRGNKGDVHIIKKDSFASYSAADELLKWAKLKEEGLISEKEFDDARKKILDRE